MFSGDRALFSPSFLPSGPGPVSDFRVTSVTTRTVSLAWSSNDSVSFKILTTEDGAGKSQEEKTNETSIVFETSIVIRGLYPGTKYCFEIFPQGPNGTEGDPQTVCNTTGKQIGCIICKTVMVLKEHQYNL